MSTCASPCTPRLALTLAPALALSLTLTRWKLDVPEEERSEQPPGAAQLWGVWDESPDSGREYWAAWNTSRAWRRVLKEVNSPKPKLIVHAHHNMPGLGDPYFVEQVMEPMRRSLSDKGCDMRLATILREPVAEITSLMIFNKVPQEEFVEKMEHHADAMSKYVTFNYETQWPVDFKQPGRTPWELGTKVLAVARDILSEFSLVGRTEDLDPFMRAVNQALGWPADLLSKPWRTGRENGEDLPPPYTPTAEQVEAVKAVNVFDSQLYHTFCAEPAEQTAEQTGERAGDKKEARGVPKKGLTGIPRRRNQNPDAPRRSRVLAAVMTDYTIGPRPVPPASAAGPCGRRRVWRIAEPTTRSRPLSTSNHSCRRPRPCSPRSERPRPAPDAI